MASDPRHSHCLPIDVWASSDIVQLVREAQQYKENLKAVFVINRKIVDIDEEVARPQKMQHECHIREFMQTGINVAGQTGHATPCC